MKGIKQNQPNSYIYDYRVFRTLIGIIGISLPVLLFLLSGILTAGDYWIQPSISHYYYSILHFLFVFVLSILGLFLILYKGKQKVKYENLVSTIAGIFSFLIAIFPTEKVGFYGKNFFDVNYWKNWFEFIHFGSALGLFICFIIFCFYIFQKNDDEYFVPMEIKKKKYRNKVYQYSGIIIIISILCVGLFKYFKFDFIKHYFSNYVFAFEWIALWAFGCSWLVKGSEIFKKYNFPLIKEIR